MAGVEWSDRCQIKWAVRIRNPKSHMGHGLRMGATDRSKHRATEKKGPPKTVPERTDIRQPLKGIGFWKGTGFGEHSSRVVCRRKAYEWKISRRSFPRAFWARAARGPPVQDGSVSRVCGGPLLAGGVLLPMCHALVEHCPFDLSFPLLSIACCGLLPL